MPQKITMNCQDMCEQARKEIDELSVADAMALHQSGEGMIVDIRDIRELWRDGIIPGAFHAPRGMLEFWIDPQSQYHKPVFAEDKAFIFCCAGGMRSALATQLGQQMGLKPAYNLIGGFRAWREADAPVEPHPKARKRP